MATKYTDGTLNLPGNRSCWWFGIGGDPNNSVAAESFWNGDIAIARIYGRVLDEEEIQALWKEVEREESVFISKVEYMSPCNIRPGYKFLVYGEGFQDGDQIVLKGASDYVLDAQMFDTCAKVSVTSSIPSGEYRMFCQRGSASYFLGPIELYVSEDAQNDIRTKVVAHRGFHDGGSGSRDEGGSTR